jgi:protein-tyrosine-phosphatase
MFEFRRNRVSGDYVLLEINARPWGSLPFPVAVGVDFPFLWYELLVHNMELPRAQYRSGIYSRNLVQDLNYFQHKIEHLKNRPWQAVWFSMKWLIGFWRFFVGTECWDSLVLDDPRPGLAEFIGVFRRGAQRVSKRIPGMRSLRRRRAKRVLAKAYQDEKSPIIVFVCHGNIYRSPFAARQLERFLEPHAKQIKIVSAGILGLQGRSSPGAAILAARERGVDLKTHRSRHLSRALAESTRVLVVFDELNMQAVLARYPALKTVVRLGDLSNGGSEFDEIKDPFGRDLATIRAIYAAITDCNRAIALSLFAPREPANESRPVRLDPLPSPIDLTNLE